MATISSQEFFSKGPVKVVGNETTQKEPIAQEPTLRSKVSSTVKEGVNSIRDIKQNVSTGQTSVPSAILQTGGKIAETGLRTAGDVITSTPVVKDVVEAVAKPISQGIQATQTWLENNPTFQNVVTSDIADRIAKIIDSDPDIAKNAEAINNIANAVLAIKGTAQTLTKAKPVVTGAVETVAETAPKVVEKGVEVIKQGIKPAPTVEQAIGQILQGKTTNIKPFQTAIQVVDTEGVKTYADLKNKFDEIIPTLAQKVDEELVKDTTPYSLSELSIKTKSKGGQEVSTDYVTRALANLKELYESVGDDVSKVNIEEIINKANSEGLTRKEINDISRTYNQEFGSKAFSRATGEPMTSVNAQAFETTRKGLKDVARAGIGGAEAKAADQILSSVYDSKKLIERNVEAVNKLKQRIEERGWISNLTYSLLKAVDTLSMGAIRGATDAVLNRGTGLKTLNAIDLEANLERNLGIIKKAMNASSEKEVQNILKPAMDYVQKLKENTRLNAGFVNPGELFEKSPIKINNIVSRLDKEDIQFIKDFQDGYSTKKLTKEMKAKMDDMLGEFKLTAKNGDEMATIGQLLVELFESKKPK